MPRFWIGFHILSVFVVFSSPIFLYVFLPIVLVGYFLLKGKWRNVFLVFSSLFFYAWGEALYVLVMIGSLIYNYIFGRLIDTSEKSRKLFFLSIGILGNLALLGYFKYLEFFLQSVLRLEAPAGDQSIHLPLGISFFTFQALSYLIDTYRNETPAQRNFLQCALYISLFPQLIAGPIVRYKNIASQLASRAITLDSFASGIEFFIIGFAKKLILANPLGEVADAVFALSGEDLTTTAAWIGILCYSLQIYFDFSGYSDMARGLGRLFGFDFPINFCFPYAASSFRDFWRRWHITLSSWFKDYVYIPLGGNRCSPWRRSANLWIVFVLCGLWHGASWNFLLWGILHGGLIVSEKWISDVRANWLWQPIRIISVHLMVVLAWVLFRAETLSGAVVFYQEMFSLSDSNEATHKNVVRLLDAKFWTLFTLGFVLAFNGHGWIAERFSKSKRFATFVSEGAIGFALRYVFFFTIFALAIMQMAANQHNPFIYFRF